MTHGVPHQEPAGAGSQETPPRDIPWGHSLNDNYRVTNAGYSKGTSGDPFFACFLCPGNHWAIVLSLGSLLVKCLGLQGDAPWGSASMGVNKHIWQIPDPLLLIAG